jgi:hypothetical protein
MEGFLICTRCARRRESNIILLVENYEREISPNPHFSIISLSFPPHIDGSIMSSTE